MANPQTLNIYHNTRKSLEIPFQETLSFHFFYNVKEILALHPKNRKIWNEIVERENAILFHEGTLSNVFEKAPPFGIDRYCYFVLLDEQNKLLAWIPGYFSKGISNVKYGQKGTNRLGNWLTKTLLKLPYFKKYFPQSFYSKDLIVGHDMEQGRIFKQEHLKTKDIFAPLFKGIIQTAKKEQVHSLSFRDLNDHFSKGVSSYLMNEGFVVREGCGYAYLNPNNFDDLGGYFKSLINQGSKTYGKKSFNKLLKGNYLPQEISSFLKENENFGKVRERGKKLSLRHQTKAWLMAYGFEKDIPKGKNDQIRSKFYDEISQNLLQDDWIGEFNYEVMEFNNQTLDGIFPLWEMQSEKYNAKTPYISKEWFKRMNEYARGECFFQLALCNECPVGFFFVFLYNGIYYAMFCGFDPLVCQGNSLYFTMHVQSFVEAKKMGAHTIALGPGDFRMNQTKKNLGANVQRTKNFIHQTDLRLPVQIRWSKLRWVLRKFNIRIGSLEIFPEDFLPPPTEEELHQEFSEIPIELKNKIKNIGLKYSLMM